MQLRPRVLHFIDTGGPGGAETVFASIASHCQATGKMASAVVPRDGWLAEELRRRGIEPVILSARETRGIALFNRLIELSKSTRAEVFHAHLLGASVHCAAAGMFLRIPTVAVFHGATDLHGVGSHLAVKRWLLRKRHVFPVAVSEAVLRSLREWGLTTRPISLIRNGVDTNAFVPGTSRSLHEELGLPAQSVIVGALGNIRPVKNYPLLLDTAQLVVKRVPHAHFVIVGSGDEHDTSHLKARASSLGISSNVHFLGFRGATASLIQCFSVLLSSSDSEGLPLSFLEAMATGIPIVATSNEGASSLLTDTKAGLLCPVRNESRLAEAVIELLENPFVARQMATNGRSAACDRYSLTRTLERYDELYRLALTEMRSVISG